jgi:hypothetical protein
MSWPITEWNTTAAIRIQLRSRWISSSQAANSNTTAPYPSDTPTLTAYVRVISRNRFHSRGVRAVRSKV